MINLLNSIHMGPLSYKEWGIIKLYIIYITSNTSCAHVIHLISCTILAQFRLGYAHVCSVSLSFSHSLSALLLKLNNKLYLTEMFTLTQSIKMPLHRKMSDNRKCCILLSIFPWQLPSKRLLSRIKMVHLFI